MHCGLPRRAAVDETQDAVSSRAEARVEPEWPGQRVSGLEIDRDPLVVAAMCQVSAAATRAWPTPFPRAPGRVAVGPM